MPNPSGLPTAEDLESLLVNAGVLSSTATSADKAFLPYYVEAAAKDWAGITGWDPFLKDAADVTRYYTPPIASTRGPETMPHQVFGGGKVLRLDAGLLTLTSLTVGYTATSSGRTMTQNSDFWLQPRNAIARGLPFDEVLFAVPQWGPVYSIVIVGKWGYCASSDIPYDAWLAILSGAAALATAERGGAVSGGLASLKLSGDTFTYAASGAFTAEATRWRQAWEDGVRHHKRIRFG